MEIYQGLLLRESWKVIQTFHCEHYRVRSARMNIIITINSRWIFQSRKYLLTQTFKVFTIQSLQKSIKFPFCLNNRECKTQLKANAGLLQPVKIENPSKYWIQSIIHENVCVDDLSRIEIHNLMESCDQVLIKVKDSAPTAVICTLAIKIAKHREEEGENFAKQGTRAKY